MNDGAKSMTMKYAGRGAAALLATGALVSGALTAVGTASADDSGYGTWCPGQPLPVPQVMQLQPGGGYNPGPPLPPDETWDMTVCHQWYRGHTVKTDDGQLITGIIEGPPPQINCGLFWCPKPPGS